MKNNLFFLRSTLLALLTIVCACQKEPDPIVVTNEDSVLAVYAGTTAGYKDGPALDAQFQYPTLIATGPDKSLYVVDRAASFVGRDFLPVGTLIRRISPDGIVSTFFDVAGSNQGVASIRGIAVDKNGAVFISDRNQIKKISPDGKQVTLIAGDGTSDVMRNGAAFSATFFEPSGLTFHQNGCLYIMDTGNNAIRILASGKVSTLAGGIRNYSPYDEPQRLPVDETGEKAEFDKPQFITIDESGNTFVSGGILPLIRMITPAGRVTTFFNHPNWEINTDRIWALRGVIFHKESLYFNRNFGRVVGGRNYTFAVSRLDLNRQLTVLSENEWDGDELIENLDSTLLVFPTGLAVIDDNLYIVNSNQHRILKIALE